jgi:hypothetical protein
LIYFLRTIYHRGTEIRRSYPQMTQMRTDGWKGWFRIAGSKNPVPSASICVICG